MESKKWVDNNDVIITPVLSIRIKHRKCTEDGANEKDAQDPRKQLNILTNSLEHNGSPKYDKMKQSDLEVFIAACHRSYDCCLNADIDQSNVISSTSVPKNNHKYKDVASTVITSLREKSIPFTQP